MRTTAMMMLLGVLLLGNPLSDARAGGDDGDETKETIEVKRAEEEKTKHPTLRFLKDNRVFLRAQLDRLRTQITKEHSGEAEILDERYLWLQQMAADIAAATDSVGGAHRAALDDSLLGSVTELGDLEGRLGEMESLLAEQRRRLLMLEEDFLGRQETSLVILVKGLSNRNAPASIVVGEDNEFVRIELNEDQRASLERGGIAQIYHEFVEPREHAFIVSFAGRSWSDSEPVVVNVEAARDRMTFLELDLSQLDSDQSTNGLLTSVWYR